MCTTYLKLFGTIFIVLLSVGVVDAQIEWRMIDSDVVEINNTIDRWQINLSSGIGLTNVYPEWWSKNIWYGCRKAGQNWNCIGTDDLPINFTILNDTVETPTGNISTWVNVTGNFVLDFAGGRAVNYTLTYHLNEESWRLEILQNISNIGSNLNFDVGFKWGITDIKIANDYEHDWMEYFIDATILANYTDPFGQEKNVTLNKTNLFYPLNITQTNLTTFDELNSGYFILYDQLNGTDPSAKSLELWWDIDQDGYFFYDFGTEDTIEVLINLGSLSSGDSVTEVMYWQDAPQRASCQCANRIVSMAFNESTVDGIVSEQDYNKLCFWSSFSSPPCVFQCQLWWDYRVRNDGGARAIHFLDTRFDYNSSESPAITSWDYGAERLMDDDVNPWDSSSGSFAWYRQNSGARADVHAQSRCSVGTQEMQEVNYTIHDNEPPSVTIETLYSNQLTDVVGHGFFCNATDNTQIRNVSLWGNITGTWERITLPTQNKNDTLVYVNWSNFTHNFNNLFANYTFGCFAQDSNASNGNVAFSDNITITMFENTVVQLHTPINNTEYNSTPQDISFICSAVTNSNGIDNLTLIIDELHNQSFEPSRANLLGANTDFEAINDTILFQGTYSALTYINPLRWKRHLNLPVVQNMTIMTDDETGSRVFNLTFDNTKNMFHITRRIGVSPDGRGSDLLLEPNTDYTASGWLKSRIGSFNIAEIKVETSSGSDCTSSTMSGTSDWRYMECNFTTGATIGNEQFNISFRSVVGNLQGSVFGDNFSVRLPSEDRSHNPNFVVYLNDEGSDDCSDDDCDVIFAENVFQSSIGWARSSNTNYFEGDYLICGSNKFCLRHMQIRNLTAYNEGNGLYSIWGVCWDILGEGQISTDGYNWTDCQGSNLPMVLKENVTVAEGVVDIYAKATSLTFLDALHLVPQDYDGRWFVNHTFVSVNISDNGEARNWTCNLTKADASTETGGLFFFTFADLIELGWEFAIVVSLIFSILTMTYIGVSMRRDHPYIASMFILLIFFFLLGEASIMYHIANPESTAVAELTYRFSTVYMWVGLVVTAVFILGFFFDLSKLKRGAYGKEK